jgi:phosphatidylglycerophosphate synthase
MLAVAGLALAGAALVGLALASSSRPPRPLADTDACLRQWADLHGGFDPRGNAWVYGWLRLTYMVARPVARRGVQPDLLTIAGLWLGGAALVAAGGGGRWALAAFAAVVIGGLTDGLDGAVALLSDRATPWGSVLDSLVDRVADLLALLALVALGGPPALAAGAGAGLLLLEYLRARAASAGMPEIGVVTVGERGARVAVVAAGLLAAGLWPAAAGTLTGAALLVVTALTAVGLVQLLVVVRRRLRPVRPGRSGR